MVRVRVFRFDIEDNRSLQINEVIVRIGEGRCGQSPVPPWRVANRAPIASIARPDDPIFVIRIANGDYRFGSITTDAAGVSKHLMSRVV